MTKGPRRPSLGITVSKTSCQRVKVDKPLLRRIMAMVPVSASLIRYVEGMKEGAILCNGALCDE